VSIIHSLFVCQAFFAFWMKDSKAGPAMQGNPAGFLIKMTMALLMVI